jgi:hypothetical protein
LQQNRPSGGCLRVSGDAAKATFCRYGQPPCARSSPWSLSSRVVASGPKPRRTEQPR